jgi:hypothetical protein
MDLDEKITQEEFYRHYSQELSRTHWQLRHPKNSHDYSELEEKATKKVMELAQAMGYRVNRTVKNCPFDLWIEGTRVEVKAATWHESKKGGRYQAAIRNHTADLVIFDCINGTHHFLIIPMPAIAPRKSIAVWSYNPGNSTGQWVGYLEMWTHLKQAIAAANQTWQPPLF